MERIGASSYTIYLYHPLFVAAVLSGIGLLGTLPTSESAPFEWREELVSRTVADIIADYATKVPTQVVYPPARDVVTPVPLLDTLTPAIE